MRDDSAFCFLYSIINTELLSFCILQTLNSRRFSPKSPKILQNIKEKKDHFLTE